MLVTIYEPLGMKFAKIAGNYSIYIGILHTEVVPAYISVLIVYLNSPTSTAHDPSIAGEHCTQL